jgi:manganese/zinc/iron transport system permease protein
MPYNTLIVLIGTALLGAVAGMIGSFAVLRRRALMGDALSHAALPGICAAFLILGDRSFIGFLCGAVVSGTLGVLTVTMLRHSTRIKEDAAIGIVLSVFFGAGIVLSRIIQNLPTGNRAGLESFIYGKTAGIILQDVIFISVTAAGVLATTLGLYKEFKILSFDREFAAVQGWPVLPLDMVMMGLLVVTTVIGLPAVGVILMAAMLIIPGAAARFWTHRLDLLLVLAAAFGALTGIVGTLLSAERSDLPAGAIIVLTGTAVFLISMLSAPQRGMIARLWRLARLRRMTARENLLRNLYELSERDVLTRPTVTVKALARRRDWPLHYTERLVRRCMAWGDVERTELGAVRLTEDGLRRAADVVRSHRLWELYLIDQASIAEDHVDRDADTIEHFLPANVVAQLEARLDEAGRWPKGSALPPASPHVIQPQPETPPAQPDGGERA